MNFVKKCIALVSGVGLLGATLAGAGGGITLGDFPEPFVKDGNFNGFIVVGDQARAEDVIGAVDIAMSLQYSMKSPIEIEEDEEIEFEGDAWKVETSSKKLELSETVSSIRSSITETDLEALKDETFKAQNTVEYEQELKFSGNIGVVYEENDDDEVKDFLEITKNDVIVTYKLTFKTGAESEISGTTLEDFEDSTIVILGKDYTISKASYDNDRIELTLMGGAVIDIMEEGETKTFTVNGKEYKVELHYVSKTECKFSVNDEVTKSLEEGEIDIVSEIDIGVRDIMENEAGESAGGDKVEFYLGADKIMFNDGNVTKSAVKGTMEINGDGVDYVAVDIKGSKNSNEFIFESLELIYTADDDYWVGPKEMLSEKLEDPEALINFDIAYEGLSASDTENINVVSSGDDKAVIEVELVDGKVDVPLAYAENGLVLGDNNNRLVLDAFNGSVAEDDYFILTTGTGKPGNDEKSYILQYLGADVEGTMATVEFRNLATRNDIERTFNIADGKGVLTLGGEEFIIKNTSVIDDDDFNISIGSEDEKWMVTNGGAVITLSSVVNNQTIIHIEEADSDMLENSALMSDTVINVGINGDEVTIDYDSGNAIKLVSDPEDSDINTGLTPYGAEITLTDQSSSPDEFEMEWPLKQRTAQAFVTSGATKSVSKTTETDAFDIVKIDVGAAVLASEIISDMESSNLILVGGPCANEVAAKIMGNPEICTEGFEAGKAKIKLFDNGEKIAMLVAGATALDTRAASQYVAEYEEHKGIFDAANDEIDLTVTSLSSMTAKVVTNGEE